MAIRHVLINTLTDAVYCDSVYHVRRRQTGVAKNQKSYLTLTLADRSGEITARVFNNVDLYANAFSEGDFLYIQGRVQTYEGKLQVIVDALERIRPEDVNPDDFLPVGRRDPETLLLHLRDLLETIGDEKIRALCLSALDGEVGGRFLRAPAAQAMHHAYIGGLLEHTLSMMMILDFASRHYKNVNRDILLAGGLLHDVGKIYELQFDRSIGYTDHGRLIPHLIIGVQVVDRLCEQIPDFPESAKRLIQHIILSHHGSREFGSPVLPSTVEAVIVHLVDDLDAKVFAYLNHIEKAGPDAEWTERHHLIGTYIRRTTETKGPLYGYNLPDEAAQAAPAEEPDAAAALRPGEPEPQKPPKKAAAKTADRSGELFDRTGKK